MIYQRRISSCFSFFFIIWKFVALLVLQLNIVLTDFDFMEWNGVLLLRFFVLHIISEQHHLYAPESSLVFIWFLCVFFLILLFSHFFFRFNLFYVRPLPGLLVLVSANLIVFCVFNFCYTILFSFFIILVLCDRAVIANEGIKASKEHENLSRHFAFVCLHFVIFRVICW